MTPRLTCARGHEWPGPAPACPTCGGPATLESLGAPPATAAAVRRLGDELARAAGPNFSGLVLYGRLAPGRFRAGKSAVNVVVLLQETSAEALAAVAPALRAAWRAARVEPFVLRPSELPQVAEAFPSKLLDIQAHHVVLA